METMLYAPGELRLAQVKLLWGQQRAFIVDRKAKTIVEQSHAVIQNVLNQGKIVYGINTGFGKLANKLISPEHLVTLQHNLLRSHAVGVGADLESNITKLMLLLKVNSLAQGMSGVRWTVIEYLEKILNSDIQPCVPAKGSVGASGDLAPLAHLSLLLIGEGEALYQGKVISGATALESLGLTPLALQPKEGLALINGTQASCAILGYALYQAQQVFDAALCAGALSWIAVNGNISPLDPRIHTARKFKAQETVAAMLREMINPAQEKCTPARVQDPYSIRCQPQVMGACLSVLQQVADVVESEINAVTDNPLIFIDTHEIVSGGNFHAEPLAFAADQLAAALVEIGNIAERRINLLCDESLSGLPGFLSKHNGVASGFMMAHVTAAALCSENKMYAHPIGVDNIPTSGNQEDHVSMATSAAYRLFPMIENIANIVSIELLAACQALDLGQKAIQSSPLQRIYSDIRQQIRFLDQDRVLSGEIKQIHKMIFEGVFELSSVLGSNSGVFTQP